MVPVSRLIPACAAWCAHRERRSRQDRLFQVLNELGTLDRDDYARCQTILDHMVRNALTTVSRALRTGSRPASPRTEWLPLISARPARTRS